jgi:hypothetical protein
MKMIKKIVICVFVCCCCWIYGIAEGKSINNKDKSPYLPGICTYRILSLQNSRFQATELFNVKEKMAIIIKGYGNNYVTVKIFDSLKEKQVLKLTDYIPGEKHKIWIWDSLSTGTFQAVMYINGIKQDDVYFKVVPEKKLRETSPKKRNNLNIKRYDNF